MNNLKGDSGGTRFAHPLLLMRDTIKEDNIKELLVVFLTDGDNTDEAETQKASRELENALDSIYSKFNVIGFGDKFQVQILAKLINCGT